MKVMFQFPSDLECRLVVDEKRRLVVVEPVFFDTNAKPTAYVSVEGAKGRARRFTVTVSPRSGRLVASEHLETLAPFDELTTSDGPPEETNE